MPIKGLPTSGLRRSRRSSALRNFSRLESQFTQQALAG